MAVEYRTIDPKKLGLQPTIVDPKAVEFYRRHPDRAYHRGRAAGGRRPTEMPSLDRLKNGRLKVMQGNHRIAAAIAEDRPIEVEIRSADPPNDKRDKPQGFWEWLRS